MCYPMGVFWARIRSSLICTHDSTCHVSQLPLAANASSNLALYPTMFPSTAWWNYELLFRSLYCILDIILLELVHSFPFFLATSSKVLHQWYHSTVLHNHTVSEISSLKVSPYYSSSWILYWTVVTCSSEQVSSFFSCRQLYTIYPTSKMHQLYD